MIRRKISTGVLRATKSSSSLRSTALAQQAAATTGVSTQQSAGLASATLLNSQRNWGKETVVTLKGELKKRGLSQAGNKSTLVDRLTSAETSALLPPMPSASNPPAMSNFSRQLSTTTTVLAGKPRSRSSSQPPAPKSEQPVNDDAVLSTGPEVHSQRTEAPKTEDVPPEQAAAAPGLPETAAKPSLEGLQYKMPDVRPEAQIAQTIPLEPDNFQTTKSEPESSDSSRTPKVLTVAGKSTHIGGGPTHALQETADALESVAHGEMPPIDYSAFTSGVASALSAPARAVAATGIPESLPKVGPASGPYEASDKPYEPSSKRLNDEERRGAWIFGGIVSLGLLLGGGRKKKEKSHEESGKGGHGAKGVKGDANWEKASGAGIVGHGARKD